MNSREPTFSGVVGSPEIVKQVPIKQIYGAPTHESAEVVSPQRQPSAYARNAI